MILDTIKMLKRYIHEIKTELRRKKMQEIQKKWDTGGV